VCTVSVISLPDGFRVVVNRDEADARPPALPPTSHTLLDEHGNLVQATWPTDPVGGGTWLGINDRGVLLTLLNYNLEDALGVPRALPASSHLRSRGEIIPQLLTASTAAQAINALQRWQLQANDRPLYAPFRLIAVGAPSGSGIPPEPIGAVENTHRTPEPLAPHRSLNIIEARWDTRELLIMPALQPPACFASSGLGDSLVQVRAELFEQLRRDQGTTPAMQDEFHHHQWPNRKHLSVMMSREGVRTVSVSTASHIAGKLQLSYKPVERLRSEAQQ
jgi:hypothetical protein